MKTIFVVVSLVLIGGSHADYDLRRTNWIGVRSGLWKFESVYATVDASDQVVEKTLPFPEKSNEATPKTIVGIKHLDFNYEHPSTVTILDGGVNQSSVTIKVTSQPGQDIMSTFTFYYKEGNPRKRSFDKI